MEADGITIHQYLAHLPEDKQESAAALKKVIWDNMPEGFEEIISMDMIEYVVPHHIYSEGHFRDSKLPLPFVNIVINQHFIAIYHMGIYSHAALFDWFSAEYPKHVSHKAEIGKSYIRLNDKDAIPYALIGQLMSKIDVNEWISAYQEKIIPLYTAQ